MVRLETINTKIYKVVSYYMFSIGCIQHDYKTAAAQSKGCKPEVTKPRN
jgi:hypothetical protein